MTPRRIVDPKCTLITSIGKVKTPSLDEYHRACTMPASTLILMTTPRTHLPYHSTLASAMFINSKYLSVAMVVLTMKWSAILMKTLIMSITKRRTLTTASLISLRTSRLSILLATKAEKGTFQLHPPPWLHLSRPFKLKAAHSIRRAA